MTAPDREEARRIALRLVEERLAACCNIIGGVESIYRWEGAVERAEEVMVVIKTTEEMLDRLQARVAELHGYDVPELIAMPIVGGLPAYLSWVRESVDRG